MIRPYLLLIVTFFILRSETYSQGIPSRNEAKIDLVQAQYNLSGEGVVTVMMDRGIDFRHPDFIDENGNTRLAYIYDLYDDSGANDPDNPFGEGTIFDEQEINASLQSGGVPLSNDIFGHGTATTGIIVGNGSAVSSTDDFRGVAFQSKIISIIVTKDFVPPFGSNPGQQGAYNPEILTYAFQFAEEKVAELNMPSVTLLNIGSIQDPTDGSIAFCDIVNDYVANGHTFVCGVGDDGGKDNHLISNMVQSQTSEIIIEKGETGYLRFTGWYSENDRFEFTIVRPNGQVEGPFSSPSGASDAKDDFLDQVNIYHRGADVEFSNSSSNLRQLLIDFFGEVGTYTISITPTEINSDGKMNSFLNPSRYNNNNSFVNNINPGGNINPFSACHASISPGDYVVTNTWKDIDGVTRMKNGEGLPGELWKGSSRGPTMDDRLGIDLVAPGELAWAAYSEDSYYAFFKSNTLENSNGSYGIQNAVSAAAPIVTGVIALMLEINPNLSPAEIKTILQESAIEDSFTGVTPNVQWGHGKLDALEAINQTYFTVRVDDKSEVEEFDITVTPNPANNFVEISYPDYFPATMLMTLYLFDGNKLKDFEISSGDQLDISDLPKGIYVIHGSYKSSIITNKFIKN